MPPLQVETGDSPQRTAELLGMRLQQNDALELGALDNGLRYVILPNRSPPSRFEAHLEIHAGSGAAASLRRPVAAPCCNTPALRPLMPGRPACAPGAARDAAGSAMEWQTTWCLARCMCALGTLWFWATAVHRAFAAGQALRRGSA